MYKIIALFGLALALTACQTTQQAQRPFTQQGISAVNPDSPIGENATRVNRKNPDPDRWSGSSVPNSTSVRYICKPLACSTPASVTTTVSRSPTAKPDETALKKHAQEDATRTLGAILLLGSAKEAKIQSTQVTEKLDFPATSAVLHVVPKTGNPYYLVKYIIFSGNMLVTINSSARDLPSARKNAETFVNSVTVSLGEKLAERLEKE